LLISALFKTIYHQCQVGCTLIASGHVLTSKTSTGGADLDGFHKLKLADRQRVQAKWRELYEVKSLPENAALVDALWEKSNNLSRERGFKIHTRLASCRQHDSRLS
jgi:hypothetical protein